MKHIRRIMAVVLCGIVGGCELEPMAPHGEEITTPTDLPSYAYAPGDANSPYGIAVNSAGDQYGQELLNKVEAANISWVRLDFHWVNHQSTLMGPLKEHALTGNSYQWANDRDLNILGVLAHPPGGGFPSVAAWADFAGKIVERYPEVKAWAIFNEVNCTWNGRESLYYDYIRAGAPKLRKYGAKVVVGDLAYAHADAASSCRHGYDVEPGKDDRIWAAKLIHNVGTYVDAFSIHLYWQDYNLIINETRNFASKAQVDGRGKQGIPSNFVWPRNVEVWLTEVSGGTCGSQPSPEWCGGNGLVDDSKQADYLTAIMSATNNAYNVWSSSNRPETNWTKTFFWHLVDIEGRDEGILNHPNGNREEREAYRAYKALATADECGSNCLTLYRKYWQAGHDHLITANKYEATPPYVLESFTLRTRKTSGANLTPLYRCYGNFGGNMRHFLSLNYYCGQNRPAEYQYGYIATSQLPGSVPLYEYNHPTVQDHTYTYDAAEQTALESYGWYRVRRLGYVWR